MRAQGIHPGWMETMTVVHARHGVEGNKHIALFLFLYAQKAQGVCYE